MGRADPCSAPIPAHPPCCCTPPRSSPAPGGTACRAGRSSSWRTRSRAPHTCRSPSASRAATWLGRGGRRAGPREPAGTPGRGGPGGGTGRGEAQAGPGTGSGGGTARPPGCRGAGKAPLGSHSGRGGAARPPRRRQGTGKPRLGSRPRPRPGGGAEAVWDSASHTTGTEATRGAPPGARGLDALAVI